MSVNCVVLFPLWPCTIDENISDNLHFEEFFSLFFLFRERVFKLDMLGTLMTFLSSGEFSSFTFCSVSFSTVPEC